MAPEPSVRGPGRADEVVTPGGLVRNGIRSPSVPTALRVATGAVVGGFCAFAFATNATAMTATAGHARQLATEACSQDVRGAIEAFLGAPLPAPQQGTWQANRYVCLYSVGDGTLSVRVDVLANKHQATSAFVDAQRDAPQRQRLNGLGQAAFQTPGGLFVGRKDRFVIRIDPSGLPARINHSDITFAAAVQLLSCWAGTR